MSSEQGTCFEFKVLDGPSIFTLDKNHGMIYVYHCPEGTFKKYCFVSFGIDSSLSSNYCIKTIASDSECSRTFCFVDIKFDKTSTITNAFQITQEGIVKNLNPVETSDVLLPPKEHWQTVTAFSYHKLSSDICGEPFAKSSSKRENFVLFTTKMKQFVISKGNWNIWCCDIPFKDCLKIDKIEVPYFDVLFLLKSKSLQCCVISWNQKKVIRHWTEIHDTFVDDFCHSGHNQILILFSNVKSDDIRFSLTDFLCCKKGLEDSVDNHVQSIEVQTSLQAVKKALVHNIQTMELETEDKQTAYDKKNQLMTKTWVSMQKMSVGVSASKEDSPKDLLPLFAAELNNFEDIKEDINMEDNPLKILEQHHCTAFNRLVVSLKVLNNTRKQLKKMNLQIFLTDCLSQGNVAVSSTNYSPGSNRIYTGSSPNSPLSAHPGDTLVLSASTEMPHLLLNQPVVAPLIVEWHQIGCKQTFACNVGKVVLDLKEYSDALYFPDQNSLTSHLESIQVEVTSSHYSLSDSIDRLTTLLKRLKCEVIMEARHFDPKNCIGDNRGQVFVCLSKSGMIAVIHICARTIFDATQLFYILQAELPNGCIVTLPLKKQEELEGEFANCLDNELSLLNRMLKCTETRDLVISDMDVDIPCASETTIDDPTQAVERKRQRIRCKRKLAEMLMQDGKNLTIDQDLYEEYCKALQTTNSIGKLLAKIYLAK